MLFKDIPGLEQVKSELIRASKNQRVSHAQLFYSRQGSSAFILACTYAQYLACTNKSDNDSCGKCPSCKQFSSFNYPDMHYSFPFIMESKPKKDSSDDYIREWQDFIRTRKYFTINDWLQHINAKTKKPIINVRESQNIIRKLSLKAYKGPYKSMLIWLPEYMHPDAANKLLKLLEEPEGNTVLLLISENPDMLLQTITSRCQKVYVPQHNEEEIAGILTGENIDSTLAKQAAHLADGNVIEAKRIAEDSARYHEYAEVFKTWMRACFKANVNQIFDTVEELSKWDREKQKEAIRFYLQTIQMAMQGNIKQEPSKHPLFERVSFSIDNFSKFIHQKNAGKIYRLLDEASRDINRNGNAKLIFSDCSFKMSNYFHIKA